MSTDDILALFGNIESIYSFNRYRKFFLYRQLLHCVRLGYVYLVLSWNDSFLRAYRLPRVV